MSDSLSRAYRWFRRYMSVMLMIVLAFIIFVLFFNEHSVMKSMEYSREIERLENEIKMKTDTIIKYKTLNDRLKGDRETMERIVRENYHFQRVNEDVYVFDETSNDDN